MAIDLLSANKLLVRLPGRDKARLRPSFQTVNLKLKEVLYEPGSPFDYVYFPVRAMLSMIRVMQDGAAIEVATVGNEGMADVSAFQREPSAATRCVVQIPGAALRMPTETLKAEVGSDSALRRILDRYESLFLKQVYQSVACNGLHQIQQRCSRWLLQTHDRCGPDEFPMTHQFMAEMLGVRQASVSPVFRALSAAGLIRNGRGKVQILDVAGLEQMSCECYRVVKFEFDRVLG
jgi:CRP-like cAMP-binding protein